MYGDKLSGPAMAGQISQPSAAIEKTNMLRNVLMEIRDRLQPVLQSSDSAETSMAKHPTSSVALQRELDDLIDIAQDIRNSIVL